MKYKDGKEINLISDLIELKDKASLEVIQQLENKEEIYKIFIELIEAIQNSLFKLNNLLDLGYPLNEDNQEFKCLNGKFLELKNYEQKIVELNNS